jgi:hypothetical protein
MLDPAAPFIVMIVMAGVVIRGVQMARLIVVRNGIRLCRFAC